MARKSRHHNSAEKRMVESIDKLSEYNEFIKTVPKILRKAILEGKAAPEIYEKFSDVAAVRVVQILLTEKDSMKALAAAKELLDRSQGKAVERKQIKHQFEELPDEELDAIILSEMDDLKDETE